MEDWWKGGGESGGPSEADLRAAGFEFVGGDSGYWKPPQGWVRDPSATMGYAPPPQKPAEVGFRPTEQALQKVSQQAPAVTPRFVETGEGGYTTYDYADPASQAKAILAQPEKVTPEYIARNYPGFEKLPPATLKAMADDWRNAYSQLMKISAPEKLPEGYAQAVSRVEGGKPFISFGGPAEIFQEAAPYVRYDPQYGLIVPQQAIQPYREKFGLMNVVPSLMLGAAFGPMAGALGGGITGAAAAGALTGAASAALNDGDILKSALTGGVTGGLGAAASPAVSKAVEAAGISGAAADAVKAGALAAGKAALTGGDPLQAALVAATGAGVGSTLAKTEALQSADPAVAKAITAAATGAAKAAASGGDPITAALMSAAGSGVKSVVQPLMKPEPAAIPETKPTSVTDEILSNLGIQETQAADLQRILADAGIAVPEQRGLLTGEYKQEGIGDVLARGAESALGAVIPSAQATGNDRLVLPQPSETEAAQPQDYKYFFDMMQKGDPEAVYAGLSQSEREAVDRAGKEFQSSSQDRQLDLLTAYKSGQLAPVETPTESWIDRGMLAQTQEPQIPDILDLLSQQQTQQQAMQQAVSDYGKPIVEKPTGPAQAQSADALIAALEQATGQKMDLQKADILSELAKQASMQRDMEAGLRGEMTGMGSKFDQRLADILTQQDQERLAMQQALEGSQAATQQQIAGVQTGLGQQISGLGKTLGEALAGTSKQFDTTTKGLQQQIAQAQGQANMGNLLAMLGLMQQQKKEAPPIPLVGEIKPYEFSTDLLAGIYNPERSNQYLANEQLLNLTKRLS